MADSKKTPSSSGNGKNNQSNQPTQPSNTLSWDPAFQQIGLPSNQPQLTPEQFRAQHGHIFTAGTVDSTVALPTDTVMYFARLEGWDQDFHGDLVRLPDAANGQSRWAGNNQIASKGAILERHPAFYQLLASRLNGVPSSESGHEVVNDLLGKAKSL